MKISEHEMRGLLTGKCVPGDMKVNEELPTYLLRKLAFLHEQVQALAAENVALKSVFNTEEISEEAVEAFTETAIMDHDWDDTGSWSWVDNDSDVIRAVLAAIKPETPATDALLREIRAQGVEMAENHLFNKFPNIGVQIMALQWLTKSIRAGEQPCVNVE